METEYLGLIMIFGGTFAPQNWVFCNGQLLQISQYEALFSLITTTYGGDGASTFGVPDLRSYVPVGFSPTQALAAKSGQMQTSILQPNMPPHTHPLQVTGTLTASFAPGCFSPPSSTPGTPQASPVGGIPSTDILGGGEAAELTMQSYGTAAAATARMAPMSGTLQGLNSVVTGPAGTSMPISLLQPILPVNFIMCAQGIYPNRPN